jgi:hypothetical protein
VPKIPKSVAITVFILLVALVLFFGSAPPSPVYFIKISRETLQSLFIFGEEDRASWALTLAEKRITEAEKLNAKKMDFLADNQLRIAENYQSEAEVLIESLKDKVNRNYLFDKFRANSDRILALKNSPR